MFMLCTSFTLVYCYTELRVYSTKITIINKPYFRAKVKGFVLKIFFFRKTLVAPSHVDIGFLTLKGPMRGVVGDTWVLKNDLPTIDFFSANKPHLSCMPELAKTVEADVNALKVMVPGDFYFWGGAFGRASRLALIADHIGRTDLIDKVISVLKESVEYWFNSDRLPVAAYETGWGGIINKEGWNNTWVDFGNVKYSMSKETLYQ